MLLRARVALRARRTQRLSTTTPDPVNPSLPSSAHAPTPLQLALARRIQFSGPLPLPSYMRDCLTHPKYGYYTTRHRIFGRTGDFVTAPQISQVFGELIAVWIAAEIRRQKVTHFHLAELGPGDARLMRDVLRSLTTLHAAPTAVTLVEASPILRCTQRSALAGMISVEPSWHQSLDEFLTADLTNDTSIPVIFLAQEFLDALPVHVFQRVRRHSDKALVWRERLVDANTDGSLRFVTAPGLTPANALLDGRGGLTDEADDTEGAVLEVGGEGLAVVEKMTQRIAKCGGAALMVDYGAEKIRGDTLRAISRHGVAHALTRPGECDVTADVNFSHMRRVVDRVDGAVRMVGSVSQREFLLRMGAAERFRRLARVTVQRAGEEGLSEDGLDRKLRGLQMDYDRLTGGGDGGMGTVYRVAAVCPVDGEGPVGFG